MFCTNCGKEISEDSMVCAYCGAPVPGREQAYNGQPGSQQAYNGQTSSQQYNLKPDDSFNLVAGLFTWIWALVKGMWDLCIFDVIVCIVLGFVPILLMIYLIARIVIVGRNANYYYRLKETQGIPMHTAITDPNLRRL